MLCSVLDGQWSVEEYLLHELKLMKVLEHSLLHKINKIFKIWASVLNLGFGLLDDCNVKRASSHKTT